MNRLLALTVALCAVSQIGAALKGHGAQQRAISINAFQFRPEELTVAPGDTVTWSNDDLFVHVIAADSGAWASPELRRGQRFVFVAADTGRFPYHCSAHPVMRGVLVVHQ